LDYLDTCVVLQSEALNADKTVAGRSFKVGAIGDVIVAGFTAQILILGTDGGIRLTALVSIRLYLQIITVFAGMTIASEIIILIAVLDDILALSVGVVFALGTAGILDTDSLIIRNPGRIAR
jgi:hypothetical protein